MASVFDQQKIGYALEKFADLINGFGSRAIPGWADEECKVIIDSLQAFEEKLRAHHVTPDEREYDAEFKAAVRLQPDYPEAHYHLGEVLQNEADLEGAADEYEKALRSKPDYPEALNKRGEIEIALRRPYSAYDFLWKALHIQPDFVEARYNLGRAFEADGKFEDALAEYKRAHELAPENATISASCTKLEGKLHRERAH